MKCPMCGCLSFYVKDPDDDFELYHFDCKDNRVCFDPAIDPSEIPALNNQTDIFCQKCAWHGRYMPQD